MTIGFAFVEKVMTKDTAVIGATVLVLSGSEERCADIASTLRELPGLIVHTHVPSPDLATPAASNLPSPDFIIADVGSGTADDLAIIERLRKMEQAPPIVALLDRGNERGTVRAIRAGATDVLLRPVDVDDIFEIVNRIKSLPGSAIRDTKARDDAPSGKLIAFVHVSGGAGSSTLAVNSAVALAAQANQRSTFLIDLDLQFGASVSLLDLSRWSRVEDVISDPSRLDGDMLETLSVSHKSGLLVLTPPREPLPLDALDPDGASQLMRVAKRTFTYTVVDLPTAITAWTAAVLKAADVVYLVVESSVPVAHRTRRYLELLRNEGLSRLPLKVVINRAGGGVKSGGNVDAKSFAKAIGREINYFIPNDFALVSQSHSQGKPAVELKPNSAFANAVKNMLSQELDSVNFDRRSAGLFSFGRK